MPDQGLLSVVVPCYNEAPVIERTHQRLAGVLDDLESMTYEIIYVDDGSVDATADLLRRIAERSPSARVVALSRNFGHQVAISAGIDHARGDAVVVIDADLQDPPEVIAHMVALWRTGVDVAYGVRTDRAGETRFKLWTAKLFYRLINRLSDVEIPLDAGDFRLMDRRVADALGAMPERDRFVRGMVSWLGFRQAPVPYRREARFAGETKYPLFKMVRFALDGLVSFSAVPLRLATFTGFAAAAVALAAMVYGLVVRVLTEAWVSGWTSIFVAVLFVGGLQLMALGLVGEYIARVYGETKRRPLYLVGERIGFEDTAPDESSHPVPAHGGH